VTISYDPSELLPPSLTSHEVATYEVTGVANATQKYQANATAPLKVGPLPEQEGRLTGQESWFGLPGASCNEGLSRLTV
jgi:hypothetical protein